ncbi:hypothetical protein HanXRQr2_Chr01g0034391 [Helianthus annuus]|uniref:Uncharacterized protein n=1 Tax=Helianthus annuus TaxID=4232 RepID=A0A9K3JXQ8_HELAN|nr:hypothetical protein HanXRQr2_Chr01g0034391 [Helianthus annuus]
MFNCGPRLFIVCVTTYNIRRILWTRINPYHEHDDLYSLIYTTNDDLNTRSARTV